MPRKLAGEKNKKIFIEHGFYVLNDVFIKLRFKCLTWGFSIISRSNPGLDEDMWSEAVFVSAAAGLDGNSSTEGNGRWERTLQCMSPLGGNKLPELSVNHQLQPITEDSAVCLIDAVTKEKGRLNRDRLAESKTARWMCISTRKTNSNTGKSAHASSRKGKEIQLFFENYDGKATGSHTAIFYFAWALKMLYATSHIHPFTPTIIPALFFSIKHSHLHAPMNASGANGVRHLVQHTLVKPPTFPITRQPALPPQPQPPQ